MALDDVAADGQPKANTAEGGASAPLRRVKRFKDEFAGTSDLSNGTKVALVNRRRRTS